MELQAAHGQLYATEGCGAPDEAAPEAGKRVLVLSSALELLQVVRVPWCTDDIYNFAPREDGELLIVTREAQFESEDSPEYCQLHVFAPAAAGRPDSPDGATTSRQRWVHACATRRGKFFAAIKLQRAWMVRLEWRTDAAQ
eukprot:7098982-Prymnesium_polylepis.3